MERVIGAGSKIPIPDLGDGYKPVHLRILSKLNICAVFYICVLFCNKKALLKENVYHQCWHKKNIYDDT